MKPLRAPLMLLCVQALAAFLWTFYSPSESASGAFLWLSAPRLWLAALALTTFLALVALTIYVWHSNTVSTHFFETLDRWCIDERRLGSLLITLVAVPLPIFAAICMGLRTPLAFSAYRSWAPETFPLLYAVVKAILPLLCLLLLASLEVAAYLGWRYRNRLLTAESWPWTRVSSALILLLIALAAAFHWIILGFQLRTFVNLPAWYWKVAPISFSWRDGWYAVGFLAVFALAGAALVVTRRIVVGLLLVIFLGWFLQIGVGIMGGGGFATLRERYFSTYHKAYVAQASQSHVTVLESVRRYEQLFAIHAFTSTKPPGLMALYIGLDHLINGYPSAYTDEVRYERLSQVITQGFPLLALVIVPLLYAFGRRFLETSSPFVPSVAPLLYVLAPSAVLFSLFPDQAIYPVVFLLGVWLTVAVVGRASLVYAFVLGALLYLVVFFAFTMLPLYPFAGLYLILRHWRSQARERWQQPVRLAAAIGVGTLVLYFLFVILLHYDFFPRFERTMAINHNFDFYLRVGQTPPSAPESVGIRLGQIVNAAWINNLDFAAGIGFPLYILFVAQAMRRAWRFFKHDAASGDVILMSLLLSFVVLNLLGTAQGEVPRLWLFWLPMIAIFAAYELEPHTHRRLLLFSLGLAQFITMVLTFHFQDLRM
jgi:hypothetical protein